MFVYKGVGVGSCNNLPVVGHTLLGSLDVDAIQR